MLVASIATITPMVASAGATSAAPIGPVSTLSVVSFPISLGYNPSNGYVYAGGFNGSVSVISGTKVIGSIPSSKIGYTAQAFAYSPSNQAEYVAGGDRVSQISGLNTASITPNGGLSPQTLMYDPLHGYVYVANLWSIYVIASNNSLKAYVPVDPRPGGFAYDTLDNYTYATYVIQSSAGVETGTHVYIFSGVNQVSNVTLGGGMGGFVAPVYDACHDYVYVANTSMGSVSVIWADTVVGQVAVGQEPASLAYDAANGYVYVANYDAGTVSVLSGTQAVGTIAVGRSPTAVAYNPYDGNVYVANENSGTVSVISGTTLAATIAVGKNPVALVYDASNNDIYVANNGGGSVSVIPPMGAAGAGVKGCSPQPAGLITTTTATSTVTTTATSTVTNTATVTTTHVNTTTATVTISVSAVSPVSSTSQGSNAPVTSTTTVYLTSTLASTQGQPGPVPNSGGAITSQTNTNATTTSPGNPATTSSFPLSALIVIPIAIVAFLGGLIVSRRRGRRGSGSSDWDVPI